jgi:hypothetical protein
MKGSTESRKSPFPGRDAMGVGLSNSNFLQCCRGADSNPKYSSRGGMPAEDRSRWGAMRPIGTSVKFEGNLRIDSESVVSKTSGILFAALTMADKTDSEQTKTQHR